MNSRKLPVLNSKNAVIGYATSVAFKQASALIGTSVAQNFRQVNGQNRLCWTPAR